MFDWDLFLSYGWSGNAAGEGGRAWVAELRERLRIALRTPLGRDPKIFLDTNATRAGALTPVLEQALDRSKTFLFVVSPGSCESSWCEWEILRFFDCGNSIATRNEVLLPEDRFFGVRMSPVSAGQIPEPLRPLVFRPFDLTCRIEGRDSVKPVDWNHLDEIPQARGEFDRLVDDLQKTLLEVERHRETHVSPTGVTVFLGTAPTPAHEKEYLTPLRRDLLLRGHRVIRASAVRQEIENDYSVRLGAVLGRTRISVQILGEPVARAGWQQAPGIWQMRRSRDYQKSLSLFTWVDRDWVDRDRVDHDSEPGARELTGVLGTTDQYFDRRQPFNDLRSAVLDRAAESAIRLAAAGTNCAGKTVAISFCEEDRPYVKAIRQRLQDHHGHRVQLALPPGQTAGERNRANRGLFEEVDAILVYHSRHEVWLALTCGTVRKVIRKRGQPKPAALVLHPPPPPKDDCDQLDFVSLRRNRPDDFDAIDAWAHDIKGGGK